MAMTTEELRAFQKYTEQTEREKAIEEIKVYVGTYKKYAEGDLHGEWVTIADYGNEQDFLERCMQIHEDEDDPEFMFQDFQDWPDGVESDEAMEMDEIFEYIEFLRDNEHIPIEAVNAALENYMELCDIEDSYIGYYDDDQDFAREMALEVNGFDEGGEDWPSNCIDWEAAADELMYDHFEEGGYYFRA